jgi:hypothetical protein
MIPEANVEVTNYTWLTHSKPRMVKESSDSGVELKQAAESVTTLDGPALGAQRYVCAEEEKIILAEWHPLSVQ